jgi:hypothetical protein
MLVKLAIFQFSLRETTPSLFISSNYIKTH